MALPKNRPAILAILAEISPRILGQKREGFSCNCGAIHCGPATAVGIVPGGNEYPGQEVSAACWTVEMRYHPEDSRNHSGYGLCLSAFISYNELDAVFEHHFGNQKEVVNEYRQKISSSDRAKYLFDPVVRILDNQYQTRFCFSWGNLQSFAKETVDIYQSSQRRNSRDSVTFKKIVKMLSTLSPEVYAGGPEPELLFEPKWLMDYKEALKTAASADHLFFQNIASFNEFETDMDIVFMKVPMN